MRSSIVTTFLVALVFLAVPPRAPAQETAPAGGPEAPARVTAAAPAPARAPASSGDWSIGAGVTMVVGGLSSAFIPSPWFSNVFVSPGATASLERRLASSTWLVVGVQGARAWARWTRPA
jgi:hypothetical protein